MAKYTVAEITIEDAKDSFAEWANENGSQSESDIARWQDAYYKELKEEIKSCFPNATVIVRESDENTTQLKVFTKIKMLDSFVLTFDYEESDEEIAKLVIDERVKEIIDGITSKVAGDGNFWD